MKIILSFLFEIIILISPCNALYTIIYFGLVLQIHLKNILFDIIQKKNRQIGCCL